MLWGGGFGTDEPLISWVSQSPVPEGTQVPRYPYLAAPFVRAKRTTGCLGISSELGTRKLVFKDKVGAEQSLQRIHPCLTGCLFPPRRSQQSSTWSTSQISTQRLRSYLERLGSNPSSSSPRMCVHPRKQQVVAPGPEALPPMWETWMTILAHGFNLPQPAVGGIWEVNQQTDGRSLSMLFK